MNIKSKPIKKSLICILTDKERREYGISLATTLGDMEQVETEKKSEMDNFKNRLAGMQARIDELGSKVRNGKEWREVDCQVLYGSPDKEHKQTIRLDTGETVSTEIMTDTDLQLVMPLDDSGPELQCLNGNTGEAVFFDDGDDDTEDNAPGGMMRGDVKRGLAVMISAKKAANREEVMNILIEDYGDSVVFEMAKQYASEKRDSPVVYEMIRSACREADPAGDW